MRNKWYEKTEQFRHIMNNSVEKFQLGGFDPYVGKEKCLDVIYLEPNGQYSSEIIKEREARKPRLTKRLIDEETMPIIIIHGCQKYIKTLTAALWRNMHSRFRVFGLVGDPSVSSTTIETIVNPFTTDAIDTDPSFFNKSFDLLKVPGDDNEFNSPLKMISALQYCLNKYPNTQGIWKTDDNIVNQFNVHQLVLDRIMCDYWGFVAETQTKALISQYCWGHGYWLSNHTVREIVELYKNDQSIHQLFHDNVSEDIAVGVACNTASIYPKKAFCDQTLYIEMPRKSSKVVLYMINLDQRQDRWEPAFKAWSLVTDAVIRIPGVKSNVEFKGCGLAHVNAIRRAYEDGNEVAFVVEDDCIPMPHVSKEVLLNILNEAIRLKNEFDVINLNPIFWKKEVKTKIPLAKKISSSSFFYAFDDDDDVFPISAFLSIYSNRSNWIKKYAIHASKDTSICPNDRFGEEKWTRLYGEVAKKRWFSQEHAQLLTSISDNGGPTDPKIICNKYVLQRALKYANVNDDVQIITAFFPIKSKQPVEFYLDNAKHILSQCRAHITLYTTKEYESIFTKMRGDLPFTVIVDEVDENNHSKNMPIKTLFSEEIWKSLALKMSRRHNGLKNKRLEDLLRLYLSKVWYVSRKINDDAETEDSQNTIYMWIDIGSCRSADDQKNLDRWPSIKSLRKNIQELNGGLIFNQRKHYAQPNMPILDLDSAIAGACIFGLRDAWKYSVIDVERMVQSHAEVYDDGICDETIYYALIKAFPAYYKKIEMNDENWFATYTRDI